MNKRYPCPEFGKRVIVLEDKICLKPFSPNDWENNHGLRGPFASVTLWLFLDILDTLYLLDLLGPTTKGCLCRLPRLTRLRRTGLCSTLGLGNLDLKGDRG